MRMRDREASSPALEGTVQRPHGEGKREGERRGLKLRLRERKKRDIGKVKELFHQHLATD